MDQMGNQIRMGQPLTHSQKLIRA